MKDDLEQRVRRDMERSRRWDQVHGWVTAIGAAVLAIVISLASSWCDYQAGRAIDDMVGK